MPKPKIDRIKLNQMLKSGKAQKEIAQFFGVTEGAVSKAKKELNISVIKSIALENAHRVVDKNLNAVEQLQKINADANEILDLLMQWNRGDEAALQILESQVRYVKINGQEEPVKEYKMKDPRELALKAMAEIRSQLKLQLDIFQCLYDMKAVEEFQQEVLSAIAEVQPHIRDRIIQRLNERRALRRTVSM